MPVAITLDLAEEHLHFALPRHLSELVYRGDQQRGQPPINLLIDHDDRQALGGGVLGAEHAASQGIAAEHQRPACSLVVQLDLEMFALLDLGAAPGAVRKLVGRPAATERSSSVV